MIHMDLVLFYTIKTEGIVWWEFYYQKAQVDHFDNKTPSNHTQSLTEMNSKTENLIYVFKFNYPSIFKNNVYKKRNTTHGVGTKNFRITIQKNVIQTLFALCKCLVTDNVT